MSSDRADAIFSAHKASMGVNGNGTYKVQRPRTIVAVNMADVIPRPIEYHWKPTIPKNRPVAIEGAPGIGKSSLIYKIASHLTTGKAFPNLLSDEPPNKDFEPIHICLFTSEDDPSDTIRPRLEINGADCRRVTLIQGWTNEEGEKGQITMRDTDLLRATLEKYNPGVVVFDPFQAYFGAGADMNKANETRPVLAAVDAICRDYECTPIFVRHVGKARREAINAGLGSIDISGIMRSIIFVGGDPNDDNQRIIAHAKSNGGRMAKSITCTMVSKEYTTWIDDHTSITCEAPYIKWNGLSNLSANDLSMPLTNDDQEERSVIQQAAEFLTEILKDGPMLMKEVEADCKANGFAAATIRRAKAKLRIKSKKLSGDDARWEWRLPDSTGPTSV